MVAASATSTAAASTPCSARRCAPPARSWASTRSSARRTPSRRPAPTAPLPTKGRAFISVANRDKRSMIFPARELVAHGFELLATSGTAEVLQAQRHQRHRRAQAERGHRARTASRPSSSSSTTARSTSSSTPRSAPAAASTATRSAPRPWPAACPCLTTVQALAAAVQGIDALNQRRHRRALAPGARGASDRRPRLAARRGTPAPVSPSAHATRCPADAPDPEGTAMYKLFFSLVFKRMDPEQAHHLAFPGSGSPPASRCCAPSSPPSSRPATRRCAPRRSACGCTARSGSPPASTRTPSRSTAWRCSASTTSRSAPSPASPSPATRRSGCSAWSRTGR